MSSFPEHWDLLPLEDVMEAIIDYRGKTPKKSDSGIPLITAKIVKNGRIETPSEFISEKLYDSWMVRGLPEVGDVVVTTEAPLGEVGQLDDSNVALAQRIVTLRGKKGVLDNDFLLFLMQSKYMQEQLDSRASGSTVRGIKQSELRKLTLPIPPEDEQIEIAKHLKCIDKKIELNRQVNCSLESIAQAIFNSWFIDFEPVRAKIQAKQNGQDPERASMCAISGKTDTELDAFMEASAPKQRQTLIATAALFPDELVAVSSGQTPKGWEITPLGELVAELRRGVSPKYVEAGGIQVVNQKCIRDHIVDFSLCRRNDPEKRKTTGRELQVGDVLVNSTGVGTLGRLAPIRYLPEKAVADSHVTVVRADTEKVLPAFLAEYLLSKETFIENSGAGSTGQTELRKKVLAELPVCRPNLQVQEAFAEIIDPLYELFAINEREQQTLNSVRDALLPKLLSGDLNVQSIKAMA